MPTAPPRGHRRIEGVFFRLLGYTASENLGKQLGALFEVLDTPENARRRVTDALAKFPYVNGAIFAESMPTQFFTPTMRDALLNACRFRWTNERQRQEILSAKYTRMV